MEERPTNKPQLAGLVLALLGIITYGATSIFGLVLCIEWLRNPIRSPSLRFWDGVGLVIAVPGVIYFCYVSMSLIDYAPGGANFNAMIAAYWAGFAIWLMFRARRDRR